MVKVIKKTGDLVVSNTKDLKSTVVGGLIAAAHLYQHLALGSELSMETLFAAGYIVLGVTSKHK